MVVCGLRDWRNFIAGEQATLAVRREEILNLFFLCMTNGFVKSKNTHAEASMRKCMAAAIVTTFTCARLLHYLGNEHNPVL